MVKLVRSKLMVEKQALQEVDGKISDLFYKDMESMDKLAYPVLFCLEKYGCFVLSRLMYFTRPTKFFCTINYIFYNKNEPSYLDSASTIVGRMYSDVDLHRVPPSQAAGFANGSNVFVYIKVDTSYLPYGRIRDLFEDGKRLSVKEGKDIIKDISDEYVTSLDSCTIDVTTNSDIDVKKVLSDFKKPIDKLKGYYPSSTLKEKTKLPISGSLSKSLNVLKHELTHVYDTFNGFRGQNYFAYSGGNKSLLPEYIDKDKFKEVEYLLYFLWSKTEFNAFAQTYGSQNAQTSVRKIKDTIKEPVRTSGAIGEPISTNSSSINNEVKRLSSYISDLQNYEDLKFWEIIQDIVIGGIKDKSSKEKIEGKSVKSFKTYFINTSKKLLSKFRDNTIKKSSQQASYNKDSQILAKNIRESINENISKNTYGKDLPFKFKLSFPYYIQKESSSFPVTVSFTIDDVDKNKNYLKDKYAFCNNSVVILSCKKLDYSRRLTYSVLYDMDSFFKLYCELVTKQRKSYLDSISIEMADDLRPILDNVICCKENQNYN